MQMFENGHTLTPILLQSGKPTLSVRNLSVMTAAVRDGFWPGFPDTA
jgi:hypothetical protein